MREVLFRGKGDKNWNDGRWFFGVPMVDADGDWNICTHNSRSVVISDTIGEYTGITDKNGKKIFEGDIVRIIDVCLKKTIIAPVAFRKGFFVVDCGEKIRLGIGGYKKSCVKVIGNTFDDKDILEGGSRNG